MTVRTPVAHARLVDGPSTLRVLNDKATADCAPGKRVVRSWYCTRRSWACSYEPMEWAADCSVAGVSGHRTRGQANFKANRRRTGVHTVLRRGLTASRRQFCYCSCSHDMCVQKHHHRQAGLQAWGGLKRRSRKKTTAPRTGVLQVSNDTSYNMIQGSGAQGPASRNEGRSRASRHHVGACGARRER
jgi:hypothetical protein